MYLVINAETEEIVKQYDCVAEAEQLRRWWPNEPYILVAVLESNLKWKKLRKCLNDYS
tara:strand:- start:157 stop:330 length:174 start_codon:yes stop_codon:yes gene_type:complete